MASRQSTPALKQQRGRVIKAKKKDEEGSSLKKKSCGGGSGSEECTFECVFVCCLSVVFVERRRISGSIFGDPTCVCFVFVIWFGSCGAGGR
jgi:hypothetical protein